MSDMTRITSISLTYARHMFDNARARVYVEGINSASLTETMVPHTGATGIIAVRSVRWPEVLRCG